MDEVIEILEACIACIDGESASTVEGYSALLDSIREDLERAKLIQAERVKEGELCLKPN